MNHPGSRHGYNDPYRVIGVDAGASQQDIARAYRRAAQRVHPDAQPDDPQAAARFQALADAYDLLRDPGRRADYDYVRSADELDSRPVQAKRTGASPHSPGSPYLLWSAAGHPIWAGPVHVEPPAPASHQERGGPPAAQYQDPPIILDGQPNPRESWLW